ARADLREKRGGDAVVDVDALDLGLRGEKGAAQDEAGDVLGVRFGVGQSEGRSPGAAEEDEAVEPAMDAQRLDVSDQGLRRVLAHLTERPAATGAALVVQDGAEERRIVVPPGARRAAGARSAMQEEDGDPLRVAHLLVVDLVQTADLEMPR